MSDRLVDQVLMMWRCFTMEHASCTTCAGQLRILHSGKTTWQDALFVCLAHWPDSVHMKVVIIIVTLCIHGDGAQARVMSGLRKGTTWMSLSDG